MNKQEKIQKHLSEPLKEGDLVYVKGLGSQDKNAYNNIAKVFRILETIDGKKLVEYGRYDKPEGQIEIESTKKYTKDIGINPIKDASRIQSVSFSLYSIIHSIFREEKYDIKGVSVKNSNFNPFIYEKDGKKQHYQRDFVWSEDDKKNLVDSIYNRIDCGKILIRKRGWKELERLVDMGETEIAWIDIVDGKQRLGAVIDFTKNKFADHEGNYYSELSDTAQRKFMDHQLFSYSELPEESTDAAVREQFLRLNFMGVPQSKEHIEFVKSIKV